MYPTPPNEEVRLKRLDETGVMYSRPSRNFDRICELARDIFEVPIAFVSFIGRQEQWFKAKVGTDVTVTSRHQAVCSYTILQDDVLLIEDALKHDQFKFHPHVTGVLGLRFYAGAPIVFSPGIHLGAVSVVDFKPRKLAPLQIRTLKEMGETAGTEVRLLHAMRQLYRSNIRGCASCRAADLQS